MPHVPNREVEGGKVEQNVCIFLLEQFPDLYLVSYAVFVKIVEENILKSPAMEGNRNYLLTQKFLPRLSRKVSLKTLVMKRNGNYLLM